MIPVRRLFLALCLAFALLLRPASGQAPVTPDTSPELTVGDLLPDLALIDQLGKTIHVSDFRGKALALTFIYSRCSSATLCPMVSRNFDVAQNLLSRLGASERCHLLSISLDAEHDTPEVLAAYQQAFQADARLWDFAVAREDELHRFGNSVGLKFQRTGGQIDHNLRTVVVDTFGRIRRIYSGNAWTPQELVAELRGASSSHR